jgi:hypothetical protein
MGCDDYRAEAASGVFRGLSMIPIRWCMPWDAVHSNRRIEFKLLMINDL